MEWWVQFDGEVTDNTFSKDEIRDHPDIGPRSKVCRAGEETWVQAVEDPELESLFRDDIREELDPSSLNAASVENSDSVFPDWSSNGISGWLRSIPLVFKKIAVSPVEFYSSQGNSSLLYAVFYATVINVVVYGTTILYTAFGTHQPFRNVPNKENLPWMVSHPELFMLTMLLVLPILIPLSIFGFGGVIHLFLRLFGWNDKPYAETTKMVGYASTSYTASVIPFLGGIVSFFWGIVLQVVGYKQVHKLSTGKAILMIFVPIIAFAVFGILLMVLFAFVGSVLGVFMA